MKKLIFICSLILLSIQLNAQNQYSIKGKVVDTTSSSLLSQSSISILNAKDSTLVKYSRALDNGSFEINNLKKGKYILLISYPKYADFVDKFTLDSSKTSIDYGKINLTGKARLLADVIIKGKKAAIKIKGDTTEFDPSAYNIEPNSKVEDLIKQFPGIQVDKDGKITAQGQTVTKVLVDGEEFFGDDPTLVTKNLRADMVDKVQLYDKKSDQATFTGIDDGEKTKTLNIKLKEDKKKGYFGKAIASVGTDDFYAGQLMFNKFSGKKKFSAYGILGNNGTSGLGWQDKDKYGSSNTMVSDDGGIFFMSSNSDDFESYNGKYNGEGIPLTRNGGLHFDNKFNNEKESININYKIGFMRVRGEGTTLSQNTVSATNIFNTDANRNFDNDMFRQKLDFIYEIKLDSTLTLKVSADGTLKKSETKTGNFGTNTRGDNSILNRTSRTLNNEVNDQLFNANILLTKKLKKKGRTLSLNLSENFSDSKSDGFLNSKNEFFNTASQIDSIKYVNQNKINNIKSSVFASNLTYTEPLSKSLSLVLNYGLSLSNGKSDRKSFNQASAGDYSILDPKFSNDYELDQVSNQGGAIFNYNKGKNIINIGSKFSNVNFKQFDVYNDKTYTRDFVNYMPQFTYQYKMTQYKSLRFTYNGRTNQPNINQIQPLLNNLDDLNQFSGNPDLKPSFRSNFNAAYNSYRVLSEQYMWFGVSYGLTGNDIVNNTVYSNGGRSTTNYTNLQGKMSSNFSINGNIGQKIKSLDINMGVNFYSYLADSYNYINNTLNETNTGSHSVGLSIGKNKNKKYSFWVYGGPSYNTSKTTINTVGNSNGWGWNVNANGTVQLPAKFEISTNANLQYTGKTQIFNESNRRIIWNAEVAKKFFKAENLKISVSGNDLLKQNLGFNRYASGGIINQNTYTTIQRYFMFNISWDFSKMGAGEIKKTN